MFKIYWNSLSRICLFAAGFLLVQAQSVKAEEVSLLNPGQESNISSYWTDGGIFERFDPADEVREKRNRTSKHFRNADGSLTTVMTAGNSVHYKDGSEWRTVDYAIRPNFGARNATHPYANVKNAFQTYYPANLEEGSVITVTEYGEVSERIVGMGYKIDGEVSNLTASIASHPIVERSQVTYPESFSDVDVVYYQQSDGRKLDFVLNSREALAGMPENASHLSFIEEIQLPDGWTANLVDNEIHILNASDKWVMLYPAPLIYETEQNMEAKNPEDHLTVGEFAIEQQGNKLTIETNVEIDWLLSEARNYPIAVDPTMVFEPQMQPFWIGRSYWSGSICYKYDQYVYMYDFNTYWYWGWVKFDVTEFSEGANVTEAIFGGTEYNRSSNPSMGEIRSLGNVDPVTEPDASLCDEHMDGPLMDDNFPLPGSQGPFAETLDPMSHEHIEDRAGTDFLAIGIKPESNAGGFWSWYGTNAPNSNDIPWIEVTYTLGAPTASFFAPDTTWTNSNVRLYNHSIGGGEYNWFVDDIFETDDEHYLFSRSEAGTYKVRLVVESAGESDELTREIVVIDPDSSPEADFFTSDNVTPNNVPITLFDVSSQGPHTWEWNITPESIDLEIGIPPLNAYNYVQGTNNETQNPVINFLMPGSYDIELTAWNTYDDNGNPTQGMGNIVKENYLQVAYEMCPQFAAHMRSDDMQGALTDDEGANPHGDGEDCHFIIEPCADDLFLSFDHFELECGSAYLRIWDGSDDTGVPLHGETNGFTGGGDQDDCDPEDVHLPPDRLESATGRFYIEYDGSSNPDDLRGFQLRWNSVEKYTPPTANFDVPDTVCVNSMIEFENLTTGSGVKGFAWDFLGNGMIQDSAVTGYFEYDVPDTYNATLYAYDCGGLIDTFSREIVVIDPADPAGVEIHTSNTNPWENEQVTLNADITGCMSGFEWEISPQYYTFVEGTNANSRNPVVEFQRSGCYDITFRAQNPAGETVQTETCLIDVRGYCTPVVGQAIQDIGTNYIELSELEIVRTTGQQVYTNYTEDYIANLVKGETYELIIDRPTNSNTMDRAVWIDYAQDGAFDASEQIAYESNATSSRFSVTFTVPGYAEEGMTRMRIATGFGGNELQPCGGQAVGEYIDIGIAIGPDLVPPDIMLNGDDPMYIEVHDDYIEPGATAWDNADGNITNDIVIDPSEVNTSLLGEYTVYYHISDMSGNTSNETRTVVVQDTELPEITLEGADTVSLEVHHEFDDPGVIITDNYWDDIEPSISGNFDNSRLGVWEIEYCATDGSGNGPVCVTRIVRVEDTTPPEINFPADTIYTEVNTSFSLPDNIFATDNYWSTDDVELQYSGYESSPTELGIFEIVFTAEDGSGNVATRTLYVYVEDTTPPEIALRGNDLVNVPQFSNWNDPGLIVNDNFDQDPTVITGGNFEGTSYTGLYVRTYYAVDQSGNMSEVLSRQVNVFADPSTSLDDIREGEVQVFPNPTQGE